MSEPEPAAMAGLVRSRRLVMGGRHPLQDMMEASRLWIGSMQQGLIVWRRFHARSVPDVI